MVLISLNRFGEAKDEGFLASHLGDSARRFPEIGEVCFGLGA